ncbi:MAG: ABC transporter permease [Bacillus sp. (in: firmicutes)]
MLGILLAKFKVLLRRPWAFIGLTLSMLVLSFLVGSNFDVKGEIAVFSERPEQETKPLLEQLNSIGSFEYTMYSEEEALHKVRENRSELAVELNEDSAVLITAADSQNAAIVKYEVMDAYEDVKRKEQVIEQASANPAVTAEELETKLDSLSDYNVYTIEKESFTADDSFIYDPALQSMFGFSLFLVIYTIAYNVAGILAEKKEGIWNRMIISPTRKWEMYAGNLVYSFITGYVQVAIVFCVFRFGLDIDFHGAFGKTLIILIPYVFCIIAISLLIASLAKNMQQFNVILPFVSVSMAMIGGAYWPIEIVSSPFMLALAKFMPIYYGMEALKDAAIYGAGWSEIAYPVSIMFLIGVVLMGLGIKIIDQKN